MLPPCSFWVRLSLFVFVRLRSFDGFMADCSSVQMYVAETVTSDDNFVIIGSIKSSERNVKGRRIRSVVVELLKEMLTENVSFRVGSKVTALDGYLSVDSNDRVIELIKQGRSNGHSSRPRTINLPLSADIVT